MGVTEETVARVIEKTNVAPELAELALVTAKSNMDNAIKLLTNKVIILKGSLISEEKKIYGLYIIKFFLKNMFVKPKAALFQNKELVDIDLKMKWRELENIIIDIELKNETLINLSKDVCSSLVNNFDLKNDIYNTVNIDKAAILEKVGSELKEFFKNKIEHGCFLKLEIEILSQLDFEMSDDTEEVNGEDEDESDKTKENEADRNEIFIKTEGMLSPVYGKIIETLKVGDRVELRVLDNSPQAKYLVNAINTMLQHDAMNNIVPGTVLKVKENDTGRINVTVQLAPGVYSDLLFNKGYKIKLYVEENDSDRKNYTIYFLYGILFLILFLIVGYIFNYYWQ